MVSLSSIAHPYLLFISGASPKLHGSKQVNKPEFSNTNWDIARSSPAALHIGLQKPEFNL